MRIRDHAEPPGGVVPVSNGADSEVLARLQRRVERERAARREAELISERATRELYDKHRQLELQALELRRSNEELQSFASVASHDLQEPLRKIQSFGDRLAASSAEQLDDRGRDYLERMLDAAGRMRELIGDLLAFSRVTTKAQPFTPVDLGEVVHEVTVDLETAIEEAGAVIQVDELPTIDADRLQMRQLFQNLIANALKFRRSDHHPAIRVAATPSPDPRSTALEVSDNGIGFDPKYAERIFLVFERLHGRGEYAGTGVGLAICKKITDRHEGTIVARSAPGEGATFAITLPIAHRQDPGGQH